MSKIWKVVIEFEDWETNWFELIGLFTSLELAREVKNKWEFAFNSSKNIFNQPKDWDPKKDKNYVHPFYLFDDPEYNLPGSNLFEWQDSYELSEIKERYATLKKFREITIQEFELDKDILSKSTTFSEDIIRILNPFLRDYKLDKIRK
jgi:hypothetical protein